MPWAGPCVCLRVWHTAATVAVLLSLMGVPVLPPLFTSVWIWGLCCDLDSDAQIVQEGGQWEPHCWRSVLLTGLRGILGRQWIRGCVGRGEEPAPDRPPQQ